MLGISGKAIEGSVKLCQDWSEETHGSNLQELCWNHPGLLRPPDDPYVIDRLTNYQLANVAALLPHEIPAESPRWIKTLQDQLWAYVGNDPNRLALQEVLDTWRGRRMQRITDMYNEDYNTRWLFGRIPAWIRTKIKLVTTSHTPGR